MKLSSVKIIFFKLKKKNKQHKQKDLKMVNCILFHVLILMVLLAESPSLLPFYFPLYSIPFSPTIKCLSRTGFGTELACGEAHRGSLPRSWGGEWQDGEGGTTAGTGLGVPFKRRILSGWFL